jgi:hypothetical protein
MGGGSRRLVVGGPNEHYLDEDSGLWQDVDLTSLDAPVTPGFSYYFKKGRYRYEVDSNKGIIKIYLKRNQNDRYVELRAHPTDNQPVAVEIVSRFCIRVSWSIGAVNYEFICTDRGVKLNLTLLNDLAPDTYIFGYRFVNLNKDGRKIKDKDTAEILGLIQDAWLQDSSPIPIRRDVQEIFDLNAGTVTLVADLTGLISPVMIDPTLSGLVTNADAWLSQQFGGGGTHGNETSFNVGYTAGSWRATSYLDFNFSAIPDGQQIDSATVFLYMFFSSAPAGHTNSRLSLNRCTRTEAIESQVTYSQYKNGFPWTAPGGDFTTTNRQIIEMLTAPIWMQFGPTGNTQAQFQYAYENTSKFAPMILTPFTWSFTGVSAFRSKEYATPSERPYADIVYSSAGGSTAILRRRRGVVSCLN